MGPEWKSERENIMNTSYVENLLNKTQIDKFCDYLPISETGTAYC